MPRVCSFAICLVAIMSALSLPLQALDDWQPILPEELKMTADPAHQADAIMLYHEETSNDNTRHAYVYKRVKILTEKGKERADVEIPYNAVYGGITDIKARTIAPDGTITPFTGKAFDTTRLKAHGIKYFAKTFTLPNVQVGSIIEWKYTEYWDRYFFAAHWAVQDDLYQKRAKFAFIPYLGSHDVVDNRGDIQDRVFYTNIGLPPGAVIKTTVNGAMELEMKDVQAFEEEPYEPPAELLKMRVNFYYGTEKMRKPAEFWKEQGKYWSQDVETFMGHYSSVASAANQAVSPSDTPEQKVRKIYAQVQKMRNITYAGRESRIEEILNRENESKEKHTLEDVLRKNEGHRDELTRLFVAMVRAVKIPAFVMRVSDRDEVFFQPTIPNLRQLTSEIAIVAIDGKEVFLDPGTPLCPFAQLKWQHTATQGIRQTAGGSAELAETQPPTYKEAVSKRVGRLTLAEDGSLNGKVFLAWVGEDALVHRLNAYKTDEAGQKKDLESELRAMLPSGSSAHLDSITGGDDPEQQLTAGFKVEIPSFASRAGKRMLVPTDVFETTARQPFAHGERKNPVYFDYPFYLMDDVQISLPANLQVENLPQTQPVKSDFAFYESKRTANGNVLAFSRDFAMGGIAFLPKDYDALRKFFAGVASGDSEQVVLTSAAK
jgi:Domain of Unknown Function with PDB structure (DUF3857)/Transglutaminase-like superfamily